MATALGVEAEVAVSSSVTRRSYSSRAERNAFDISWTPRRAFSIDYNLLQYARWANGRMGIEVDGMEYGDWPIHSSISQNAGESYHTVRVRADGTRAVDAYYVSQPEGMSVDLVSGSSFRTGFAVLPFRKYRPVSELYGGWCWTRKDRQWNHEQMLRFAKMGGTMSIISGWNPTNTVEDIPHRYGIKTVLYTSGIIWRRDHQFAYPRYDDDDPGRELDYLKGYYDRSPDKLIPPDFAMGMCTSSPGWRKRSVAWWKKMALEHPAIDYAYTDDNYGAWLCNNHAHGCNNRQLASGMIALNDDYQLMLDGLPNDRGFLIHGAQWVNASFAHGDFILTGEDSNHLAPTETDDARRVDHDLLFTSLQFGNQCVYYTWSFGVVPARASTLWTYEMALTRCATVMAPCEPLLGYTREDEECWSRYMSPLVIYDVENSEVHHPFDSDFTSYASVDVQGVTPVIYARSGDVLLVTAKETRESKPATVKLSLKSLGFPGNKVLVYDAIQRRLQKMTADQNGMLTLTKLSVDQGPQILRVIAQPDKPIELWHGPETWKAAIKEIPANASKRKMCEIKLHGVPTAESELLVYIGAKSEAVEGGTLLDFDESCGVAKISVTFPLTAQKVVRIAF